MSKKPACLNYIEGETSHGVVYIAKNKPFVRIYNKSASLSDLMGPLLLDILDGVYQLIPYMNDVNGIWYKVTLLKADSQNPWFEVNNKVIINDNGKNIGQMTGLIKE